MVGQRVALERPGFIVGKQLIPAAAPHIVISRADGLSRRRHSWVVPKQIGAQRLVSNLPDLAAGLRQHHNANEAVLYLDGAKPGKARSGISSNVFHDSTADLLQSIRDPSVSPSRNGRFTVNRIAFSTWACASEAGSWRTAGRRTFSAQSVAYNCGSAAHNIDRSLEDGKKLGAPSFSQSLREKGGIPRTSASSCVPCLPPSARPENKNSREFATFSLRSLV